MRTSQPCHAKREANDYELITGCDLCRIMHGLAGKAVPTHSHDVQLEETVGYLHSAQGHRPQNIKIDPTGTSCFVVEGGCKLKGNTKRRMPELAFYPANRNYLLTIRERMVVRSTFCEARYVVSIGRPFRQQPMTHHPFYV